MSVLRPALGCLPATLRLSARTFFTRQGVVASQQLPARLQKHQWPVFLQPPKEEPVDDFDKGSIISEEEWKERQECIDKIIQLSDEGKAIDSKTYEGILKVLLKFEDSNGLRTVLAQLTEVGMKDSLDTDLVRRASTFVDEAYIKAFH
eukprot:comp24659_c0_seq1/m.46821 comp24659_c0_seq1/g.46821  ORF comp24659_c0_seq1/g.46821 comp24659_c0_seq1/m.46821 type:complete len:148 (-) comp24659_c0_seq1:21-464(-)